MDGHSPFLPAHAEQPFSQDSHMAFDQPGDDPSPDAASMPAGAPSAPHPSTPATLAIAIAADPTTGYAAIQNNLPVVRGITLTNAGAAPLTDVTLDVACSPPFAAGERLRFARIEAGETRQLGPFDLRPDHGYLAALDEAETGAITVTASLCEQPVASATRPIEVLAYDQWAGMRALPELLAAFCMPNSPAVDRLLAQAAALLRADSPDLAMSGYGSRNREHVWKQVSAIHGALGAQGLHYAHPPASFGSAGQKIRTPERIIDARLATCLDLAMLFASCLEQAGLHPVVLVKDGHAWTGVWLVEQTFPTGCTDDVQAVRKRVGSGELIVFETTFVTQAGGATLRAACAAGERHLDDEAGFVCAIDIRRARALQVRPLPSRPAHRTGDGAPLPPVDPAVDPAPDPASPVIEEMPPLPPLDPAALPVREELPTDTPEGRLNRWKSRLLDLTLRNRLLNFEASKTTLRVVCPDLAVLEDTLAEGREFRIRPQPALMTGEDTRDAAVYTARHGAAPLDALAADALGRDELLVEAPEETLDARLLEIFRAASTGLEEGGANTLYLAFGFLQWKEDPAADATLLAPILLVPVTLSRQSVRSGFRLARHDDEALVNPTLLQKLAQDFSLRLPGLDVLPLDERGIDVARILQTFRLHVAELRGWEVRDTVELGIFSFTKYLMWKDLQDRQGQLLQNEVVAHLVDKPGQAYPGAGIGFAPRTLDGAFRPHDLFTPLLSDSSQLRAICAAGDGRNMVIEGPPGTGKSQTITNLIAHLLAQGRSVLFVSEKMAALDVVHRRLSAIGLGAFCLELHSSKARKADVLRQLGSALDAAGERGVRSVREWEREADRLWALRQDLNAVAEALHRVHANDLTVHEAIGTVVAHRDWQPAALDFGAGAAPPAYDTHTRAQLDALRETGRRMAALAGQLGSLAGHPLARIAWREWTPAWEAELLREAAALEAACAQLDGAAARFMGLVDLDHGALAHAELAILDELADILLAVPAVPAGVAQAAHDDAARARLALLERHGQARRAAWDQLGGAYRDDVAAAGAAELRRAWIAAGQTWWPRSWFAQRAVLARIAGYRNDARRPDAAAMPALLAALEALAREDRALQELAPAARDLLAHGYAEHRTDWDMVGAAGRWAERFADAVERLAGGDPALLAALRQRLAPLVGADRTMFAPGGPGATALRDYRAAWSTFEGQRLRVEQLAGGVRLPDEDTAAAGALIRLQALLQAWRAHARQLQPWSLWRAARHQALEQGLAGVVHALESGAAPLARVADYVEFSYRSWWLGQAIGAEPALRTFSSADHERKIGEFREADARFQKLTEQYVAARLAGQVPNGAALAPGADSELGKLRRELQKQKRHMPIRQLVQNLPTLLPRLKPCLLMSPLSVAQYLDAGHAQFDVVIFDEASQIPVWDAVGAIARGRQLVCVGDTRQLPPTSFFSRADADDGDGDGGADDVQDLESILDECLGIGLPKLTLQWHYRSRHESLIAFSNATYYDNALITFPSPATEDTGVRFQRVHGVYDRGGTRANRAEADAIVQAVEAHYLAPARRARSVGVVTFNAAQQSLIERLLDARRRALPELDAALAQATQEPLFIKNLENVQGDERDIILFSITYGPDAAGKVSLNFGPLNLEGGQRRLNVAISRARQNVVVYSTLMPEQIELSRVRASGVRDLKHYLEFALRGPRALAAQSVPLAREPDSPFEAQVIARLRQHGWTVHPQVGVSGYRIDIGVVDPRAPGRYLLGVECDGASYHSGATARDRDRLRQHVLEGLGWQLHRIWSTDWWIDPAQPMARLLARLEALAALPLAGEAPVPEIVAAPEPGANAGPEETQDTAQDTAQEATQEAGPPPAGAGLDQYAVARLAPGDPDAFHEAASIAILRAHLANVIRQEGPVLQQVLFRRVARAWGLARVGRRIEELLARLAAGSARQDADGAAVYWPEGVDPDNWSGLRVPSPQPDSRRAIDEIGLEELGNAAIYVLEQQGATSPEGLARAVSRLFGIGRTTADAEARILRALGSGLARHAVAVEAGMARRVREG